MSLLFSAVSGFGLLPKSICTYKCDAGSNLTYFNVETKNFANDITLFMKGVF